MIEAVEYGPLGRARAAAANADYLLKLTDQAAIAVWAANGGDLDVAYLTAIQARDYVRELRATAHAEVADLEFGIEEEAEQHRLEIEAEELQAVRDAEAYEEHLREVEADETREISEDYAAQTARSDAAYEQERRDEENFDYERELRG